MSKPSFYVTTTLPYVNAEPHIGFALESVQADVLARFKRERDWEVFFNVGTDEHGQKIWQKAKEEGKEVQEFVDHYASRVKEFFTSLNIGYTHFVRTTDEAHITAAQEFWRRCDASGDIYKKSYKGLYCVGCEAFVTEKDLVDGRCPHHDKVPEVIEEENYFFSFSKFEQPLLDLLESDEEIIIPSWRREEAIQFVKSGLQDFSISRARERMPWGIDVPDDDSQVMYVWFDALTNYISTLGWPTDSKFERFWEQGDTVQLAGKDQVRFQSLMWQAMLISAGVQPTSQIFYHGFITSGGQKMSKSLGNVLSPFEFIADYGADALRYYLLRHISPFDDSDVTRDKFHEAYTANLVNGLGNLVSRVMTMAKNYEVEYVLNEEEKIIDDPEFEELEEYVNSFRFNEAMDYLWEGVNGLDQFIANEEPFKVFKEDPDKAREQVAYCVLRLYDIAVLLRPFMPDTAEKIITALQNKQKPDVLFPRI